MLKKILVGYLIANGLIWAAIGTGEYMQRGIDCKFEDDPKEVLGEMFCDAMKTHWKTAKAVGRYLREALEI